MTATGYLSDLAACMETVEATCSLDDAMYMCDLYLRDVRNRNGIVHLIGNGGSASVVAHAQNDLVKACGIRALVHQDIPLLTAYANDHGYANGYTDALSCWLRPDDLVIAVSSSGASDNIVNAARLARAGMAMVITLSGFKADNPLRAVGYQNFYVPSSDYGQVELTHAALLHCLTDRLTKHD